MKVAFIPPYGWENYLWRSTGVQMALAIEPLMTRPEYIEEIRRRKTHSDDIIILDNGANENCIATTAVLSSFAWAIGADELVLPDELGDTINTAERIRSFFRNRPELSRYPKYMAVMHAKNVDEMKETVDGFADNEEITTIGIPRDLVRRAGYGGVRIDAAVLIAENYPGRFNIHMLGMQNVWLGEVAAISKYCGNEVRSIDTSLPFVAAMAGIDLRAMPKIKRQADYFDKQNFSADHTLVDHNIRVFKEWANAKAPSES